MEKNYGSVFHHYPVILNPHLVWWFRSA